MHNLRSDLETTVVLFSFLILSALGWMLSILLLQRINDFKSRNLGRIKTESIGSFFVYSTIVHGETFQSVLKAKIFDSAKSIHDRIGFVLFHSIESKVCLSW